MNADRCLVRNDNQEPSPKHRGEGSNTERNTTCAHVIPGGVKAAACVQGRGTKTREGSCTPRRNPAEQGRRPIKPDGEGRRRGRPGGQARSSDEGEVTLVEQRGLAGGTPKRESEAGVG
jgi:hypothetical protein